MLNRKRTNRIVVIALSVISLTVGVWGVSSGATAQAQVTVKMGDLPSVTNVAYYVAMEKGYFSSHGIRVELLPFDSGAKMVAPLATGDISIAGGGQSAALFNSIAEGLDFKVVADKGQVRPGKSCCITLVVRTDLMPNFKAEGLKSLKGKSVGLYSKASINDYGLAQMLKTVGMNLNDVKIVYVGPPNMITAFATKAIDSGIIADPWGARAEQQKVGLRALEAAVIPGMEDLQIAVIQSSGKFLREQRNAARGWLSAYVQGIQFYNERGLQNDEVAQIISKHTKLPPALIKESYAFYLSPDGKPNVSSMQKQRDWFYEMGFSKVKLPMEQVVDLSFLEK